MPTLIGPTYLENLWTNDILFCRYKRPSGITLLVTGTVVEEVTYPYLGDLLNNGYDYIYLGGHEYPLSDAEVTILTDAGYGAYIHYP
jgi:hypothetical protein